MVVLLPGVKPRHSDSVRPARIGVTTDFHLLQIVATHNRSVKISSNINISYTMTSAAQGSSAIADRAVRRALEQTPAGAA